MSFHNDMFHETKSERKYYEEAKQKALRHIDQTRAELLKLAKDLPTPYRADRQQVDKFMSAIHNKLRDITYYVNDI
jgi:hypothetical protein